MGIMDLIITELNRQEEIQRNGGVQRLHSEQYQIVQTEKGMFYNPVKSEQKKSAPEGGTDFV